MLRGIYTAASGMLVDQKRLDVISNNLANVSTVGFKRDTTIRQAFTDFTVVRLNDPDSTGDTENPEVGRLGFGTLLAFTAAKLTTGNMIPTGNRLDVAIEGDGFFTVNTPAGVRYSRNGSFRQTSEGVLVTAQGYAVLVNGQPLKAEPGSLRIDDSGQVYANDNPVGQLSIVRSKQLGAIRKEGNGLWVPAGPTDPTALVTDATDGFSLRAGYLESSNVEPVTEMVDMMTIVRSYEMNQKVIQAQDEALQKLVTEVARIG